MDDDSGEGLRLDVTGPVVEWRGPAPYHFVAVTGEDAALVAELASAVTYGWGMIPVSGQLGGTTFTTSLWPKDGRYLVPLKDAVRHAEGIELDDTVTVRLTITPRG